MHAASRTAYSGADMSKPDQIAGMVEQAAAELGRVDILVNNAGIQHTAPVQDFPADRWDAIIAINLSAAFHAMKAVLPADAGAQLGPDHQHRQARMASWRAPQKSAYVAVEARHRWPHQGRGVGDGPRPA